MGSQRLGLLVLVVPAQLVVPLFDQRESLAIVVGGGPIVEDQRRGVGAVTTRLPSFIANRDPEKTGAF